MTPPHCGLLALDVRHPVQILIGIGLLVWGTTLEGHGAVDFLLFGTHCPNLSI